MFGFKNPFKSNFNFNYFTYHHLRITTTERDDSFSHFFHKPFKKMLTHSLKGVREAQTLDVNWIGVVFSPSL